ncbi:MAG TPA: hypothetical protein VHS53_10055 [Mucilaginibacter sp.]|nr:hypothetical protein [Mucilaginibacter sp.]HWD88265.1 hypothetical protein [Mucilaginibacter sp.]
MKKGLTDQMQNEHNGSNAETDKADAINGDDNCCFALPHFRSAEFGHGIHVTW